MKVSSPIGDLPFKPTKLTIREGTLNMEGSMGAWPAHVQIELSDVWDIIKLIRYPFIAFIASIVIIITILSMKK